MPDVPLSPPPATLPSSLAKSTFQELVRVLPGWVFRGGDDPHIVHAGVIYPVDLVLESCAELKDNLPRSCCEHLGLPRSATYAFGVCAARTLVDFARRRPFYVPPPTMFEDATPVPDEELTPRRAHQMARPWIAEHLPAEDRR